MGMGASVNRKGPSAHANMKDKADRATNEQVLDPRTRLILYKMIGRGLIQEINGCVSTGKEVCMDLVSPFSDHFINTLNRRMYIMLYLPKANTLP